MEEKLLSTKTAMEAGVTMKQLLKLGYTPVEFLHDGCSLAHARMPDNSWKVWEGMGAVAITRALWTLESMGAAAVTYEELQTLGITCALLRSEGLLTVSGLIACKAISLQDWGRYGLTYKDLVDMRAYHCHFAEDLHWPFDTMLAVFKCTQPQLLALAEPTLVAHDAQATGSPGGAAAAAAAQEGPTLASFAYGFGATRGHGARLKERSTERPSYRW